MKYLTHLIAILLLLPIYATPSLALDQAIVLTGAHAAYSPAWKLDDYLDSSWADTVFSGFGYTALDVQPGGNPGGPFDHDCPDAVNFENLFEPYYGTDKIVLLLADHPFANSGYCETDTIAHAFPRDGENEYVNPESLVAAWEAIIREVDENHSGELIAFFVRMPDIEVMEPAQSEIRSLINTLRAELSGDGIPTGMLNLGGWPTPFDATTSQTLWTADPRLEFYTALNSTAIGSMSRTIAFRLDYYGSRMENCFNDTDSDNICDDDLDNCVGTYNPGQEDWDHDGYGDACDFDVDQNCAVGMGDLIEVQSNIGATPPWNPIHLGAQDADGNDAIGVGDLILTYSKNLTPVGPSALGCAKCPDNGPEFFQFPCP